MTSEHSLTRALRELLERQRGAALGTVAEDGSAFVSMVPFAVDPVNRCLVIHVSGLAAHTQNLQRDERVSLLVMQTTAPQEPVHALPRVTLLTTATLHPSNSPAALACRETYLARFPEAEPMTTLGDFRFVSLLPLGARQVSGFGAARSLDAEEVRRALGPAPA